MAGPGESPTTSTTSVDATRLPSGTRTIVLVIDGPITRIHVKRLQERVRALLESSDADLIICDVEALDDPDVVTVEVLARLQLTARRLGREVQFRHACNELKDLLALTGLDDVVRLFAGRGLEPRGKAEEREQTRRVEEETDPNDPTG